MASPLASIFSTVDSAKRSLLDILTNPVASAQQIVGNANDRAGVLNQLTGQVAGQTRDSIKAGGSLMPDTPESQQLTQMMADAYSPVGMIGSNIAAKAIPNTKILDAAGMPKLVYRGSAMTKENPLTFRASNPDSPSKGKDTGMWFSSDSQTGSSYAGSRQTGGHVSPAYLDMRNPLVVDAQGSTWGEIPKTALGDLGNRINKELLTTDEIARIAKMQGYDGVEFKNILDVGPAGQAYEMYRPSSAFVTFRPESVRSALSDEQMKGLIGNL
jgi:hypothetical protein